MAVTGKVIGVIRFILLRHGSFPQIHVAGTDVEFPGIPVAVLGHSLRPPVRPEAELGIAEPLGIAVLLQRLVGRLKAPRGDRGKFFRGNCTECIRSLIGPQRGKK